MTMSENLAVNLANRKWLASRLRAEIVGPDPVGMAQEFRMSGEIKLTWEEFRKPKRQANDTNMQGNSCRCFRVRLG